MAGAGITRSGVVAGVRQLTARARSSRPRMSRNGCSRIAAALLSILSSGCASGIYSFPPAHVRSSPDVSAPGRTLSIDGWGIILDTNSEASLTIGRLYRRYYFNADETLASESHEAGLSLALNSHRMALGLGLVNRIAVYRTNLKSYRMYLETRVRQDAEPIFIVEETQ